MVFIDDRLGRGILLEGADGDGCAMLVRTADKGHIVVKHAEHPNENISREICPGEMAYM
jgi:hypothetical protein